MATLYHYTDGHALLGFLRGTLWLTHIAYMNDATEFAFAKGLYKEAMKALEADPNTEQMARDDLRRHMVTVDIALRYAVDDVFVSCLSERHDDLGQWRGYTRPGPRFCIGFDAEKLRELGARNDMTLRPVTYGEPLATKHIQDTFLSAHGEVAKLVWRDGRSGPLPERAVFGAHSKTIANTATWCKNEAFHAESEWRFATSGPPKWAGVKHRSGRSLLIPYVELEIKDPFPIVSITAGPSPHQELAVRSVESAVEHHGVKGVKVLESKIPFRDW